MAKVWPTRMTAAAVNAILLACCFPASGVAPARAATQKPAEQAAKGARLRFAIPAQRADLAFLEFARQAGRQILFPYDYARTRVTPALHGEFTPEEALRRLARASGLVVRHGTGEVLMLGVAAAAPPDVARPAVRPASPPVPSAVAGDVLQQIIVTATRQARALDRVPLAVTAQTQGALDERGTRTLADLQDIVPTLQLTQLTPSLAHVTLRGIANTGAGAATTGFYMDDIPLTKRNAAGPAGGSANGVPLPPLFDLERVEVLRGPQGTLYGGSSQGGTVRYISPLPSLEVYSGMSRAEILTTEGGNLGYEAGGAIGGPLVRDVLGFRASTLYRSSGGFLDRIDRYSGEVLDENANSGELGMIRASLLWAAGARTQVTLTGYYSQERWRTAVSDYSPAMAEPIVEPTLCFDTSGITPAAPVNNPMPVPCGDPGVTFVRPGSTGGPYTDLEDDDSLLPSPYPSTTDLGMASLTVDRDFGRYALKAIASWVVDDTEMVRVDGSSQVRDRYAYAHQGGAWIPRGLGFWAGLPESYTGGRFLADNTRQAMAQEVRLTSMQGGRVDWVVGAFHVKTYNRQRYDNVYLDLELLSRGLYGISAAQRYGVPAYLVDGAPVGFDHKDQTLDDTELALFGEATVTLVGALRATAGLRLSRLEFDYVERHWGPAAGFNTATFDNGGLTRGAISETPVAPKFGVEYDLSDQAISGLVYATATKGFRAGGVNTALPETICGPALDAYGIAANDVPRVFAADTVWSYEVGGKLRLLDERLRVNAALFRIDWQDAQLSVNPGFGCNIPFVANAGSARSVGAELEARMQLPRGLSASVALSRLDARYTEDAVAVQSEDGAPPLVAAYRDQHLASPPFTAQIGLRSDFTLGARFDAFVRLDWRYTEGFRDTHLQRFGLSTYAPDTVVPDVARVNLRVGVGHEDMDVTVFVNNLLNDRTGPVTGGRLGCQLPDAGGTDACSTYSAYNPFLQVAGASPRQAGVRLTYRFD